MININSYVCQCNGIDAADIDGEKVMMNIEKGKYLALNSVGSRIWDIINEKISVNDIVNILINEYEIDEETCKKNVLDYLMVLYDAELIKIY